MEVVLVAPSGASLHVDRNLVAPFGSWKVVHAGPRGMGIEFVNVLEPSASIIRALVEARLRS